MFENNNIAMIISYFTLLKLVTVFFFIYYGSMIKLHMWASQATEQRGEQNRMNHLTEKTQNLNGFKTLLLI